VWMACYVSILTCQKEVICVVHIGEEVCGEGLLVPYLANLLVASFTEDSQVYADILEDLMDILQPLNNSLSPGSNIM
jgi:hypothetical protein